MRLITWTQEVIKNKRRHEDIKVGGVETCEGVGRGIEIENDKNTLCVYGILKK